MLHVVGLAKTYLTSQGPLPLFSDVSFDIHPGESVALMGESGCGKSTLLHILAGLEQADHGQVLINQQDILQLPDRQRAQLRRHAIGVVFQQLNLIPSLSIQDNLAFQARLAGNVARVDTQDVCRQGDRRIAAQADNQQAERQRDDGRNLRTAGGARR